MTIQTANRLLELRKKYNLSQEELAEKIGVSRQAVSKWERSEASPDTDNLIALAKLYGLSLDELIYGESGEDKQEKEKTCENKTNSDDEPTKGTNKIDIGPKGIFLESEDGDRMQINLRGIKSIHMDDGEDLDDDDFDDEEKELIKESNGKARLWLSIPWPIVCAVAYLVFGCLDICGGFALSWIIFVTIPLYYSLISAIFNKRFSDFAYPIFCAAVYLYLGMYHGNWHPSWIIFVTIPIYYSISEAIDKGFKENK